MPDLVHVTYAQMFIPEQTVPLIPEQTVPNEKQPFTQCD